MWLDIRDMRNIITHEYHKINHEEIFKTSTNDVPVLKEQVIKILENEFQHKIDRKVQVKLDFGEPEQNKKRPGINFNRPKGVLER